GYQEYKVGKGATEQPQEIDLAKLEAGEKPAQNHIRIGKHLRHYSNLIYSISARDQNNSDPHIWYSFYPIVSPSHPGLLGKLVVHGRDKKQITGFAVLVKTSDFHRLSEIPRQDQEQDSIQGMIINSIRELDKQEADLIKESFPDLDLTQVLILDQGRKP